MFAGVIRARVSREESEFGSLTDISIGAGVESYSFSAPKLDRSREELTPPPPPLSPFPKVFFIKLRFSVKRRNVQRIAFGVYLPE